MIHFKRSSDSSQLAKFYTSCPEIREASKVDFVLHIIYCLNSNYVLNFVIMKGEALNISLGVFFSLFHDYFFNRYKLNAKLNASQMTELNDSAMISCIYGNI
jgi:hypothetical protein